MVKMLFITTLRNLLKRKSSSLINILGLALGMAVCLVIGKFIEFETSFEGFQANGDRIFRVNTSFYTNSTIDQFSGYDLGPALADFFPEVHSVVRTHANGSVVSFPYNGKERKYQEPNMLFVDSTFLSVFSFGLIHGDVKAALADPYSIIVSESIARKYFGEGVNPVGKVLQLADGWVPGLYTISAVVQDVPENSHFKFHFLIPLHNLLQSEFYRNNHSRWDNFHTYIEINDAHALPQMEDRVNTFIKKYQQGDAAIDIKSKLKLQNLLAIHYSPDLENEGSGRSTIYFFGLIAVFVLVIAWINYINLSTARAMERAKEVGVKKAIGVTRKQLILQFCLESALVNFISLVLSIALAAVLLPALNDITGRSFAFNFTSWRLQALMVSFFVVGSLASGVYPALVLSSYRTIQVIKGKINQSRSGFSLRNTLVGFQFACSLLLLVVTFVVYRQVQFMQLQDKGFATQQIIVVRGPEVAEKENLFNRMILFKSRLQQFPFVEKVSTSFSIPGEDPSLSTGIRRSGAMVAENKIGNVYWVDPDFMGLYNIPVISGKAWNPAVKSEMRSAIINEEAVKVFRLGTNESALTKKLVIADDTIAVIGVMKNHHWNSLKEPFSPMIFKVELASATNISIQLKGNITQALQTIEQHYKAEFPDNPFIFYFLDDAYNSKYHDEKEFGQIFGIFSVLAAILGCLGLWGLASFATIHRLKEISVRKVLGASMKSILLLLTSQFLKPLVIAALVISPLIWMIVKSWLVKFPYRIGFSPDLFLLPMIMLLIISLLAVGFHTVRAAGANPVDALKNE